MSDHWHYEVEIKNETVDVHAEESMICRLGTMFRSVPVEEVRQVLSSSWATEQGWVATIPGECFERPLSAVVQLQFVVEQNDIRLIRRASARVAKAEQQQSKQLLEASVREAVEAANNQLHQIISRAMLLVNRKQAAKLGSVLSVSEDWTEPNQRVRQTIRMHVAENVRELAAQAI